MQCVRGYEGGNCGVVWGCGDGCGICDNGVCYGCADNYGLDSGGKCVALSILCRSASVDMSECG